MTKKTLLHVTCSKERELAELITTNKYQSEKIDEIHHVLVGNGKPGLINEFNQLKGAVKIMAFIVTIIAAAGTYTIIF